MKYVLTHWALGKQPEIPIDEERFRLLREASDLQWLVLGIEEKFDLLVSNYEEFERDLLNLGLKHMVRRNLDWPAMSHDRLHLNRRLVNYLSTSRLYSDQVKHDLKHAWLPSDTVEKLGTALSKEYDRSLGYRVVEALRNVSQHQTIPIRSSSYGSRVDEKDGQRLISFSIGVGLDLEDLKENKMKAPVLKELATLPKDKRDLVLFVRQHVEGYARAHADLRSTIVASVKRADDAVAAAIADWASVSTSSIGLTAVRLDDRVPHPLITFQ